MDKKSVIVIVITAIILIMATVLFAAVGCSQEVSGDTDDSTEGFKVTFVTDDNSTVYVYSSQDYTEEPTATTYAYAVDSESGEILTDGEGQVNFYAVPADGYTASVTASAATRRTTSGRSQRSLATQQSL